MREGIPLPADDAAIGIVLLDEQGRLLAWNSRFEQLIGYQRATLHGRTMTDFIDPAAHELVHSHYQALFRRELPLLSYEHTYVRRDHIMYELQITLSLTYDACTGQTLCTGRLEDITPRAEAARLARVEAARRAELTNAR